MGEVVGVSARVHVIVAGSWRLLGLGLVLCIGVLAHRHHGAPAAGPGQVHGTIIALAVASGLFLVAGVLRLAKWQLSRDPHSALAGTALLLMGGACLPLGGFARLLAPEEDMAVVGLVTRCVVSLLAMRLLLHALSTTEVTRRDRPEWLLPRLFALVGVVFVAMPALRSVQTNPPWADDLAIALLSTVVAAGWLSTAVRIAGHAGYLPWARRTAPLLFGMGFAELLRGLDLGAVHSGTIAGVLLCAAVAGLAVRSALADLDDAVGAGRHGVRELADAVSAANERADDLQRWREHLTHDARNSCAGIRAAVGILGHHDLSKDRTTSAGLRSAAVEELTHLEHLLTRSSSQPSTVFDATAAVDRVARSAVALGARITVHGSRADALGRPGDLAAVVKNLILNVETHAPGSTITITVARGPGGVTIQCTDDGPGIGPTARAQVFEHGFRGATSPGSGLGLPASRALLREQQGDLEVLPTDGGATFVVTLPAADAATTAGATFSRPSMEPRSVPTDHVVRELAR